MRDELSAYRGTDSAAPAAATTEKRGFFRRRHESAMKEALELLKPGVYKPSVEDGANLGKIERLRVFFRR